MRTRMSCRLRSGSLLLASGLLASAALLAPACNSTTSCTQAGCESSAVVTFPPNLVSGSFDLIIDGDSASATLRCSDPSAPETADNPPEITCNASGFTIEGHPLANEREVAVTIVPTDGSEGTAAVIRLDAVDEITPNGPDCPPICVVRNGQLQVAGES